MAFKIAICISENCKVPRFVVVPFVSAATVQWVCGNVAAKIICKARGQGGQRGTVIPV